VFCLEDCNYQICQQLVVDQLKVALFMNQIKPLRLLSYLLGIFAEQKSKCVRQEGRLVRESRTMAGYSSMNLNTSCVYYGYTYMLCHTQ
jgi:hypothetical protein